MSLNLKIRGIVLGVALIATVVLSMAQAQDYNEGLMAASKGDYNTAVMKWKPLADKNNPMAQFNMALMYHRGLGVKMDEKKAVSLYRKSAKNGYKLAQEFLAAAYYEGWFGLPRDQQKADYWLSRSEENTL